MTGQTIAQYEILEKLGQGGMGVVYKAHDTKLDRTVALKFLPSHMAASEQDRARFAQEAKAAAALNHPNVCSVIDIADHEGQMFIVMEFVDGKILREQMHAMSTKQAIDVAIQIADGLAAAHEKGIVHRDIKPENIMVRKDGIVQIMDFGLAKLRNSSSKVTRLTKEGSTVGTAGYMSPEQVQGFDSDHRSDIFSFGVLMYEMLTGQLPFKGVHETALLYEIVNVDPAPMSAVKPDLDPSLDAIVLECLEKDPKERTQSTSQISVDLKRYKRESSRQRVSRITAVRPALTGARIAPAEQAPQKPRSNFPSWGAALLSLVVVFAAGYFLATLRAPHQVVLPVLRASVEFPHGVRYVDELGGNSSLSPDGAKIVFTAADSTGEQNLWVTYLRTGETKPLNGTGKSQYPVWSPDSKSIAFFSDGKLKTIDCNGGPALALADAPFGRGIAWSTNGTILYQPSVSDSNFWSVPATGGASKVATQFDTSLRTVPRFPSFLPDGNHFVFSALDASSSVGKASAYVGSLNDKTMTPLLADVVSATYAGGYLLFLRQGILMAQQFDASALKLTGAPAAIQGNINAWNVRAKGDFSISNNGLLLYGVGGETGANGLFWINPDGTESPIVSLNIYRNCSLSPDGGRIAYDILEGSSGDAQVWVYDIEKHVKSRISATTQCSSPIWASDGTRLFYHAEIGMSKSIIRSRLADGSGDEESFVQGENGSKEDYEPEDVSPDGHWLIVRIGAEAKSELAMVDLTDKRRPIVPVKLGIEGVDARFSPDSRWIVYTIGTGASKKLAIAGVTEKGASWEIANDASASLFWTRDKIFYYSNAASRFQAIPCTLTTTRPVISEVRSLLADGKAHNAYIFGVLGSPPKYLAQHLANAGSVHSFSLVVNWQNLAQGQQ